MPSFTSLFNNQTDYLYLRNSRHATYNFNQESQVLYRNQPRFPFEYYLNINLNNLGTARTFIQDYFNNPEYTQVMPLVKSVDMPGMKIETTPLNQYNRKRISQTKINYDPVKMVFHDVADGKTLKFWEMYYRYYFGDGNEPGKNQAKLAESQIYSSPTYSYESFQNGLTGNIGGFPNVDSIRNVYTNNSYTGATFSSPTNDVGDKSSLQNIVTDTLDNHKFGFNLENVQNIRNLIQSIDIYQVHAGRFNQVCLVNPRISSMQHTTLDYAVGDKTLEITLTFEYEYAYYIIQNMRLEGGEPNNNSTLEPFEHGDYLEIPNLSFNATLLDFIESNNTTMTYDSPSYFKGNVNIQSTLGSITAGVSSYYQSSKISTSALDGLINVNPNPASLFSNSAPKIQAQSFISQASTVTSAYKDINRSIGRFI